MLHRSVGGWGWVGSALLAALSSAFACGGSKGNSSSAPPPAQVVGPTFYCPTESCQCDGGLEGQYQCDSAAQTAICNCDNCSFTPKPDPAFEACGGEPFGTWQLASVGAASITVISFDNFNVRHASQCPLSATSTTDAPSLMVDVRTGGSATFYGKPFAMNLSALGSCTGSKFYCVGGNVDAVENCVCTADSCGIASCLAKVPGIDTPASWTRTDTALNFMSYRTSSSFDYCVQGDTLHLSSDTGLVYTFQRVQIGGAPTACPRRSPTECVLGGGCHPACTGSTQCTGAADQASCTNRQGCTWDVTMCAGSTSGTCGLADYGTVPGCALYGPTAKCAGTPAACGAKAQGECGATPGCSWGPGCFHDTLTPAKLACSDSFGCGGCNYVPGCTCDQDGTCSGAVSFTCEGFTNLDSCQEWGKNLDYCHWAQGVCNGTPTPCEQLTTADCASIQGCAIQAGP